MVEQAGGERLSLAWVRCDGLHAFLQVACVLLILTVAAPLLGQTSTQDAYDTSRQWISGRVLSVEEARPEEGRTDLVRALERLGYQSAPRETVVELVRVLPRFDRLVRALEGTEPAVAFTTKLDPDGRFAIRTPGSGPWRVLVRAPGYVSMELYPQPLPVQLELPTVWLQRAVEDEFDFASSEPAWVASVHSESAVLTAQRALGTWQRVPVRQWASPRRDGTSSVRVSRGRDETLGFLWQESTHRDALFLVAAGRDLAEVEQSYADVLLEQRGVPVADGVRVVGVGAADVRFVVTVDGRPVGLADVSSVLAARVAEGAWVEVVGSDGSWASSRVEPAAVEDNVFVVSVAAPSAIPINARNAAGAAIADLVVAPHALTAGEPGTEVSHAVVLDASNRSAATKGAEEAFDITATAVGYLPQSIQIEATDATTEVTLTRAAEVVGRVIDRGYNAIVGVDVLAVAATSRVRAEWARTDERGLFRLQQLSPGVGYIAIALHPGYPLQPIRITAPSAGERREDLQIKLYRPLDAFGQVLDLSGGAVVDATVRLRSGRSTGSRSSSGLVLASGTRSDGGTILEATTDADGQFAFVDIVGGTYGVEVEAAGWASVFVPNRDVDIETAAVVEGRYRQEIGTFSLVPESVIEAQVIDQDDAPVFPATAWWSLVAVPRSSPSRFATRTPFRVTSRDPPWSNADVTDEGEVTLRGIEPGASVSLIIEAQGFVTRRVDELFVDWESQTVGGQGGVIGGPIVVRMMAAASLPGVVEDDRGRPLTNSHVSLHALEQQTDFPGGLFTRTDGEGRFSFDGLPPGRVRVVVNAVEAAVIDPVDVTLESGSQHEELVLRAPPGAVVAGRVMGRDGPLAGVTVVCDEQAGTTDAQGSFRIENVRLGQRSVEVRRHEHGRFDLTVTPGDNWVDLDVGAFAERRLDPSPPQEVQTYSVRGVVLSDEGASARLFVYGDSGAARMATMSADGSFVISGLGAGSYGLVARASRRSKSESIRIVDRDISGVEIDLREPAFGSLRISVVGLEEADEERLVRFGLPLSVSRRKRFLGTRFSGLTSSPATAEWANGVFVLDGLEAGERTLSSTMANGLYRARAEVLVVEGSATDVTLVFEREDVERIKGVLTVNGERTSAWIVARKGNLDGIGGGFGDSSVSTGTTTQANSFGQFEVTLKPGPAYFTVSVANRSIGTFSEYASVDQLLRLNVREVRIAGRVQSADGSLLPPIQVVAERQSVERGYAGRAVIDADGRFVIHALTLGEEIDLAFVDLDQKRTLVHHTVAGIGEQGEIFVTLPP